MSEKIYRHTPHRAADALKIIVGNKTNATIRDLEETEEDVQEFEGVVTSIDKDKITGDGWEVKVDDGAVYKCNCAFSFYQLPETEEYGGMYYPTENVRVKITVNPVLRTNTITEILSLGEDEQKIDLSKWKHGDKATTVIAKPKSAISISDAIISFNYDNTNEITVDSGSVKTTGEETNIGTNTLNVDSENIIWQGREFDEMLSDKTLETLDEINSPEITLGETGIDMLKQEGLGQLTINSNIYMSKQKQRVIADLVNPALFPEKEQRHPLLTGSGVDELYLYPNGLVTVRSTDIPNTKNVFNTINWVTPQYTKRNVLQVRVRQMCDCCTADISGTQEYFNYCPHCKSWNVLTDKNGKIVCDSCQREWCEGCGHLLKASCSDLSLDLKKYNSYYISAIGTACNYCKDEIPTGKTRTYANYCPKCHNWGYLRLDSVYISGEECRVFVCDHYSCGEKYCVNCSTSLNVGKKKSFLNDNTKAYYYDTVNENLLKMKYIRDD